MDTSFAERLKRACDSSTIIPEYGKGRQVAIANRLKVTQEAVRKWFTGEALPRPPKMRELAEYLEVDEPWLALGVKPELDKNDRRRHRAKIDGAIYLVAGLLMLEGGNCAFPSDDDPRRELVDLYAILRGTQAALHICMATELSPAHYQLVVPYRFRETRCVGVVPVEIGRFHFLAMPHDQISDHKQRKAGDYVIHVNRIDGRYYTGETIWPRCKTLGELI